ncbi:hypothetical protein M404DRAFT_31214 [Pisolithus tinctorius Marx 270]|uniref:Arginine--tRNA ligase n=1 Tax=Pisolithus tinctorius Marx 270 TaxID=870435 RepID=A0A0C3NTG8_PISTI|nr:hypothetical protein M404DRAFT_31214 [Pisolithus tinctorius Marx 270]
MIAVGFEEHGSLEELRKDGIKHLYDPLNFIVKEYAEYDRLNLTFDFYTSESGPAEDGETSFVDPERWKIGKSILCEADGVSLGVADRTYEQCHFDKMICAVASRQDLHFAQFFEILDLVGFPMGQSTRAPELIIKETSSVKHEQMKRTKKSATPLRILRQSAIKIQDERTLTAFAAADPILDRRMSEISQSYSGPTLVLSQRL